MSDSIQWDEKQVDAIARDLAYMRLQVDLELVPQYPVFLDKAYPLGRCKEIRDTVFAKLQTQLLQPTSEGIALIRDALEKGAVLKKIWGELRGVYFQNAMTLGDWYLDVSNDTVNPNKPRVEVLPLAESGFSHIISFEQFVKVARVYWGVEVYRNDVCPALAPFLPLLYVRKDGVSWVGEANDDMLLMTMGCEFRSAESILSALPSPPKALLQKWRTVLASVSKNEFLHGQGDAIEYCKQYRGYQFHVGTNVRDRAVMAYLTLPREIAYAQK
ncbi:MAG: hypothetical protein HWE24_01355 [Oceanospirillaceae bacterium]|nr:hypothetical protein [Oceanospirillaceae bacterium]